MTNNLGITEKGKIGQWLCKHKNKQWFKEKPSGGFMVISGYTSYQICKDCGKQTNTMFTSYD